MGEDFLRKKTEQFVRLRVRGLHRLGETSLFSGTAPAKSTETVGRSCAATPPAPGTRLWPHLRDDGSLRFFAGHDPCIDVPLARSEGLRLLVAAGTVVGEVVDLPDERGNVRVRLLTLEPDDDRDARE